MTARILDGKVIAAAVEAEVAAAASALTRQYGTSPALAAILVGEDPASAIYVRRKAEACGRTGLRSETFHLPAQTSEAESGAGLTDGDARRLCSRM